MAYEDFKSISIEFRDRVAWLTINNPPVNMFDLTLVGEMYKAGGMLAQDDDVSVVVLQSADPDFFIAHADLNLLIAKSETEPSDEDANSFFHGMTEIYRLMPKVTIGKLDGIARGGGLEILAACDMRFCSIENTTVGQPEIILGIIPGGGGSTRWPRMIGTGRALELLLNGTDLDGPIAERYGMVNRALPAAELDEFVDKMALRIASYSTFSIAALKELAYDEAPLADVMRKEAVAVSNASRTDIAKAAMREFLDTDSQSRANELKPIE
jgi:enoyl-CoA hydratase/carnithine racemase